VNRIQVALVNNRQNATKRYVVLDSQARKLYGPEDQRLSIDSRSIVAGSIAEVILRFGVVAIQEAKRETTALRLLIGLALGPHWA
jgi:hypothetical protein